MGQNRPQVLGNKNRRRRDFDGEEGNDRRKSASTAKKTIGMIGKQDLFPRLLD